MNRTGIPYLDFCWNPCGFGCSRGCHTCWARRQATSGGPTAPACPDCRRFAVHFHPERLSGKASPAGRKKPAVIGVQFLGDLFDAERPGSEMMRTLDACMSAPQHEYVFLTRQVDRCLRAVNAWTLSQASVTQAGNIVRDRWHMGVTCTTQAAYDAAAMTMGNLYAGRWWISAEPLAGPIAPGQWHCPVGVVIGSDNMLSADCSVAAIRQTAQAFAAAGVKVYVKQMWLTWCPACGTYTESEPPAGGCDCTNPQWRRVLVTDPALFPAGLRMRDLPWTLTTKEAGR